jgi:hypothetical protein
VAGQAAGQQTSLFELVTAHLEHDPPDPLGDRPDTPDQLADDLQAGLAERPEPPELRDGREIAIWY